MLLVIVTLMTFISAVKCETPYTLWFGNAADNDPYAIFVRTSGEYYIVWGDITEGVSPIVVSKFNSTGGNPWNFEVLLDTNVLASANIVQAYMYGDTIYVLVNAKDTANNIHAYVVAIDVVNKQVKWVKEVSKLKGTDIFVTSYFVYTFHTLLGDVYPFYIARYDFNNDIKLSIKYDPDPAGTDYAVARDAASDGTYLYVVGGYKTGYGSNIWIFRTRVGYETTYYTQVYYSTGSSSEGVGVVQDANYLYVLAASHYAVDKWNYFGIMKVDKATLDIVSYKFYSIEGYYFSELWEGAAGPSLTDPIVLEDGYIYIVGYIVNSANTALKDVVVGKIDPVSLNIVWLKKWDCDENDIGKAIATDTGQNRVIVAARATSNIGTLSSLTWSSVDLTLTKYTPEITVPYSGTVTPETIAYTTNTISNDPAGLDAVVISLSTALGEPIPIPEAPIIPLVLAVVPILAIYLAYNKRKT